jgi:hypothetical protein
MGTLRLLPFLALIAAQSVNAFCIAPRLKVCSAFFDSDKVFYGKVVKITPLREDGKEASGDDFIDANRYTVQVQQALKGSVKPVETVDTENASARWVADVGERRVVFVRDGQTWDSCSSIDDPRQVKATIDAIRALANSRNATIEGEVVAGYGGPSPTPVRGVKVVMAGRHRAYTALTDKRGAFSVAVEPGLYRITSPGLKATDYSRQDMGSFEVVPGQCAQLQLSSGGAK